MEKHSHENPEMHLIQVSSSQCEIHLSEYRARVNSQYKNF